MTLRDQQAPSFGRHRERSYSDNMNPSHSTPSGMATVTKKQRHHGRPRSKSCDRHRNSPARVHKKKCSSKRVIADTHSPSQHHVHGIASPGRLSSKSSSSSSCQELCGKLWVRPVAARRKSSVAPLTGNQNHAFAPISPNEVEIQCNCNHTFAPIFPHEGPLLHRVTSSPFHDEEMMRATSPNSTFNLFQLQRRGTTSPKNPRIVFGESGKPIRPRNV